MRELDTPRTTEELSTLNSQIRLMFPFSVPSSLELPETFLIDCLNAYINVFVATDTLQTSQVEAYAQSVVSHLDRDRTVIRHVLSRSWCSPSSRRGRFVKDLVVMGSDMRRTVLVDNDVSVFHPQPDNGILVADFVGQEDTELQRVQRLLNELVDARDVRSVLRRLNLSSQVNELMGHPPIHYDA